MPLTGAQTARLAAVINDQWNYETLSLFASDNFGFNLSNEASGMNLISSATVLITALNSSRPPQDNLLLQNLRATPNAALQGIANELLDPPYFSPTGAAEGAILLGKAVFVDRARLRDGLWEFINPNPNTTRVLIVRGEEPGGKSYSFLFLRHLAATCAGAVTHRLRLANTYYTPKAFFEQIFALLRLDQSKLPAMLDDPQPARIDPLINVFKGEVVGLNRPYWLVIDDLNDDSVDKPLQEAAYAVAYSVEEIKPENLWVALLGYNAEITDAELQLIAKDDAQFPSIDLVAEFFVLMANAGPEPLTSGEAREYADLLFAKYEVPVAAGPGDTPKLMKDTMIRLATDIAELGQKLKAGERP